MGASLPQSCLICRRMMLHNCFEACRKPLKLEGGSKLSCPRYCPLQGSTILDSVGNPLNQKCLKIGFKLIVRNIHHPINSGGALYCEDLTEVKMREPKSTKPTRGGKRNRAQQAGPAGGPKATKNQRLKSRTKNTISTNQQPDRP